jgi:predicted esterase
MRSNFQHSETIEDDLVRVQFTCTVDGERVPGVAWMPADNDEPMPLVLIQHPATSTKDDYFVTEPARTWARRGWICGGIDAPLHGSRDNYDPMSLFKDSEKYPAIAAQFAREVSAVIDGLAEALPVDLDRLGYVGYSMGSMLGVSAIALDRRFKVAALCLVGEGGLVGAATGEGSFVPGLAKVEVRIVGKADDELIPRAATEALYEALGETKDLVWLPGGHFEIGPDVINSAGEWMKQHL